MGQETKSHRILVITDSDYKPPKSIDHKTFIVHKNDLKKRISICLEEPIRRWLVKWRDDLKEFKTTAETTGTLALKEKIHKEIESICKELSFHKADAIPEEVKEFLFR